MIKLQFIVFLSVALSVYFGMHYFVFSRIAAGFMLSGRAKKVLRYFFLLAALSFVLTEFMTHRGTAMWLKPAADFGYVWLGVLSIALSVFAAAEIVMLVFRTAAFRFYATVISLALTAALSVYSYYNVAAGPRLKEISIQTSKLPAGTDRLVIVQLSDLHVDLMTPPRWLKNVVSKTNTLKPDVILITGDLIDAAIYEKPVYTETFKALESRYGVYAVSGNHEYYTGMDKFLKTAEESGITVIDNRKVEVGGALELIGIDDRVSVKAGKAESEIKEVYFAAPAADPGLFSILLSHRPDTFEAAAKLGIDLQLSGHTHAGQIPPMDLLVMLAFKYPSGLYRQGNSYAYTTTGTGYWGPPMRLFSNSEIVKITLNRISGN